MGRGEEKGDGQPRCLSPETSSGGKCVSSIKKAIKLATIAPTMPEKGRERKGRNLFRPQPGTTMRSSRKREEKKQSQWDGSSGKRIDRGGGGSGRRIADLGVKLEEKKKTRQAIRSGKRNRQGLAFAKGKKRKGSRLSSGRVRKVRSYQLSAKKKKKKRTKKVGRGGRKNSQRSPINLLEEKSHNGAGFPSGRGARGDGKRGKELPLCSPSKFLVTKKRGGEGPQLLLLDLEPRELP